MITQEEDTKFYTCRYDRPFKEIFLKETNRDLLITLLEKVLHVEIHDIVEKNVERNQGNIHVRRKNLDVLLDTSAGLIGIEVNANYKGYIQVRNFAFFCDAYAHYTLVGEEYSEDINIIQINFTYGLGKNEKLVREYYYQDNELKRFVDNAMTIEINMDKIMEIWYSKDEKKINEYKYFIMLDLELDELKDLSKNDELVGKYMDNLEELNKDATFREYMSVEEDQRKCHNSEMRIAREEGLAEGAKEKSIEIAKQLLAFGDSIDKIMQVTGLSREEIENLKGA